MQTTFGMSGNDLSIWDDGSYNRQHICRNWTPLPKSLASISLLISDLLSEFMPYPHYERDGDIYLILPRARSR